MKQKIKIPLLVTTLFLLDVGCKKNEDDKPQETTNTNDGIKDNKSYLPALMARYSNDWYKIISALRISDVKTLSQSDINTLLKERVNIEHELNNSPDLLNFFKDLIQASSLSPTSNRDTGIFTSEKARIKQAICDDVLNIIALLQNDRYPKKTLVDLEAIVVSTLGTNQQIEDFFSKDENKIFFQDSKAPYTIVDYKKFPNIIGNENYKAVLGETELRKQIWINIIKACKKIKIIGDNDDITLKKDRYVIYEDLFPITSPVENSIINLFRRFGISYNEDFTRVQCMAKTPEEFEEVKLFCLAFTTYIIHRFGIELKNDTINFKNGRYGLLASNKHMHFVGHQIIGLIWSVMNTALIEFPITHIPTTDIFSIDISDILFDQLTNDDIRRLIRNSLFEGSGFILKDENFTHWCQQSNELEIEIQKHFTEIKDGYATLDHRHAMYIACNTDRYFENPDHADWENIEGSVYKSNNGNGSGKKIFNSPQGPSIPKIQNVGNFYPTSFAALYMLSAPSANEFKYATYYFFAIDKYEKFRHCISVIQDTADVLTTLSIAMNNACSEDSTDDWQNIALRVGNTDKDKTQYKKFHEGVLKPMYYDYGAKDKKKGDEFFLAKCKGCPYAVERDNEATQNYFFGIMYRTIEMIGLNHLYYSIIRSKLSTIECPNILKKSVSQQQQQ